MAQAQTRTTGYAKKLSKVFVGTRLKGDPSVSTLLTAVSSADCFATLDGSNATDCRNAITDDKFKNLRLRPLAGFHLCD